MAIKFNVSVVLIQHILYYNYNIDCDKTPQTIYMFLAVL